MQEATREITEALQRLAVLLPNQHTSDANTGGSQLAIDRIRTVNQLIKPTAELVIKKKNKSSYIHQESVLGKEKKPPIVVT